MTETDPGERRAAADRAVQALLDAVALAQVLEVAAYEPGTTVELENGTRLEGQGALDRLREVRQDIAQASTLAMTLDVNRAATALERIVELLDSPAAAEATVDTPPPPRHVSGCCAVPLGDAHAPYCRWAGRRFAVYG